MKKAVTVIIFGLIGWILCGLTMGLGPYLITMPVLLVVHAVLAPVFFIVLSWIYFRKFSYTGPLTTAVIFIGIVVGLDFFLVAPVFVGSYDMFRSFPGTWLPFILIFIATYLTGRIVSRNQ